MAGDRDLDDIETTLEGVRRVTASQRERLAINSWNNLESQMFDSLYAIKFAESNLDNIDKKIAKIFAQHGVLRTPNGKSWYDDLPEKDYGELELLSCQSREEVKKIAEAIQSYQYASQEAVLCGISDGVEYDWELANLSEDLHGSIMPIDEVLCSEIQHNGLRVRHVIAGPKFKYKNKK